jgi:type IV secretory pathway TrbD component
MALRHIPIHRSATRTHTFMGADRELALSSLMFTVVMAVMATDWRFRLGGAVFWVVAIFLLRMMGKADPLLRHVYVQNRWFHARGYFAPRSTPWRKNTFNGVTTPFVRRKRGA